MSLSFFPSQFCSPYILPKTHSLPGLFQSVNDINIFSGAITKAQGTQPRCNIGDTWISLLPWMHQMFRYPWSNSLGKNPESSWVTLIHQAREKTAILKWVGKTVRHSHHKPYPQHRAIQSGGNPQFPASPWGGKCLDHISSTPTFKSATQGRSPQITYLWKPMGFMFTGPIGL